MRSNTTKRWHKSILLTVPMYSRGHHYTPKLDDMGNQHFFLYSLPGIGFDCTNGTDDEDELGTSLCSERSQANWERSKAEGNLETKKRILICCMLQLLLHLVLDAGLNPPSHWNHSTLFLQSVFVSIASSQRADIKPSRRWHNVSTGFIEWLVYSIASLW